MSVAAAADVYAASRSPATSRSIESVWSAFALDLPDPLAGEPELLADRLERLRLVAPSSP